MPVPPVIDKMITLLVALSLQRFQFSLLCLDLFLDLIPLYKTKQAANTICFPLQSCNGFLQLLNALCIRICLYVGVELRLCICRFLSRVRARSN